MYIDNFDYDILLEECFEKNEYFFKMIEIINNANNKSGEKHHIIPRSFFKLKNQKIIDDGNLVLLTEKEHYLVHYYAYQCSKGELKKKMLSAYCLMSELLISEGIIERSEEYQKLRKKFVEENSKKVICLDTGIVYDSIRSTCRELNIDRKSLLDVLNGKQYIINGKHFEYFSDNSSLEYCKQRIEQIETERNRFKKKVICLDTMEIFNSISEAEKKYDLQHSALILNLQGKNISCKDLHFEFAEEKDYTKEYCTSKIQELESKRKIPKIKNYKKKILNVELNKTFDSINEALRFLGKTSNGKFNKWLKEKETIYGYHWKLI